MIASEMLTAMLPEHILLAGLVALIVLDLMPRARLPGLAVALAAVGAAFAATAMLAVRGYSATPFPDHFVVDAPALAAKALLLAFAAPVLMLSHDEFRERRFHILTLSSLYGACLIASSASFLTLFLGIELMSLPLYALIVLGYRRPQSAEAALKYLVLGGAASAMLLMGASLLFGTGGSLGIAAYSAAFSSPQPMAWAGIALVTAALFVKASIVPFHGWAPDAYEGASVPVTAYMATVIKAGVMLAALRLFASAPVETPLAELVAVLALVSIVWGNLVAMRQTSFRRMIAYSSIAHAGYLFLALLGEGPGRYEAIVFYLAVYGLMNLLAFAALPRTGDADDGIDELRGLFSRRPHAALALAIAMLSLAGIPPLPGFVAKFLVFSNVMAAGFTAYAVAGLVGSYLGIYFYLRVIQLMFMSDAERAAAPVSRRLAVPAALLCLVPALLIALFPGWLIARL
jgi:NADH-quinone oxidoreductase subunit N